MPSWINFGEDGLSDICRYFLAGQLAHVGAIRALAAPTVNCAKRFKLYSFAPTNATWGIGESHYRASRKGHPE